MSDVARSLHAIEQDDEEVADELRRLGAQKQSRELSGQTLQAMAFADEAHIRLAGHCLFRGGGYIPRNIPCHQSRST